MRTHADVCADYDHLVVGERVVEDMQLGDVALEVRVVLPRRRWYAWSHGGYMDMVGTRGLHGGNMDLVGHAGWRVTCLPVRAADVILLAVHLLRQVYRSTRLPRHHGGRGSRGDYMVVITRRRLNNGGYAAVSNLEAPVPKDGGGSVGAVHQRDVRPLI